MTTTRLFRGEKVIIRLVRAFVLFEDECAEHRDNTNERRSRRRKRQATCRRKRSIQRITGELDSPVKSQVRSVLSR